MLGFSIPRVAMHFRHDAVQIYEACFIVLNHMYRPEPKVPVLCIKIIPLQRPGFGSRLTMQNNLFVGGQFKAKRWSTVDVVESRTMLENWCEQYLKGSMIPVCYGWNKYQSLLKDWLGSSFDDLFRPEIRDIQTVHQFIEDRNGEWVNNAVMPLNRILKYCGVDCVDSTDTPLATLAIAQSYERMLMRPVPDFTPMIYGDMKE